MRIPRIHVPAPLHCDADIVLPAQAAEHLVRVLRLQSGHPLRLFDGNGNEFEAELLVAGKRAASARVLEAVANDRESPLPIRLGQSVARGEKMDWILQKATELGVAQIVPLISDRSEVRLDAQRAERRLAHWQAVVASACEQCGRSLVPILTAPVRLEAWAATLDDNAGQRLSLDPDSATAARDLAPPSRVTLAVGPEGGWSDQDRAVLSQARFHGLRLGPRILRTETAGLAAIAALQALFGDM